MHRVRVDTEPRAVVVTADGELDAYASPELTSCFEEVSREARVVIDLGGVSFMDSTALGILVRAVRELGERNADVRVVLPHTSARRIFELTMLHELLPVAPSRQEALAELDA
jgi:anti-sigma B factor antagonist